MWPWRKKTTALLPIVVGQFADDGMIVTIGEPAGPAPEIAALLVQLADEGLTTLVDDEYRLTWEQIYGLLRHEEYSQDAVLLGLPTIGAWVPRLVSYGSLTDAAFSVAIDGWYGTDLQRRATPVLTGAMAMAGDGKSLLPETTWHLIKLVRQFGQRSTAERNDDFQRRAWGDIRATAIASGALLDDFLFRTIVLTPEQLRFNLRRGPGGVVEVEPYFDGAPAEWVAAFDRAGEVRDRYDLPTPDGVVQVMLSQGIKTVLRQIKRMPGRRVAGVRAEAFLINPTAALGPDAAETIDHEAFEAAKENAGIVFDQFATWIEPGSGGRPGSVGLTITRATSQGVDSVNLALGQIDALEFAALVDARLAGGLQLCAWRDYEFELDGDSARECARLRDEFDRLTASIRYQDIYDLSGYSERIAAIGVEKPFYSPYIAKKSEEEGWFPGNIQTGIARTPEGTTQRVRTPMSPELRETMREEIAQALRDGRSTIELPGFPIPMPVGEAVAILQGFDEVDAGVNTGSFTPQGSPIEKVERRGLIIKANIASVDYSEARRALLRDDVLEAPRLPRTLAANVLLKDHQTAGVAWMQRLFDLAPDACRGAVLADDMGLGKTLQLLCFIAAAREADPTLPPALVVAPLSLLENWKEEVERFFIGGSLKVLTAYGDTLTTLRVPRSDIDHQLQSEGLVRFLKNDWRADADIVLTTYETLRDLEFSFAREKWSIMVCDEAQKIKNPAAMMTRAAKKQQARFRIACTGTPVENSLVDLWCLFDFVQPGLLGALNEFGRDFRRPIEAESDEERTKVEELRAIVAPQILRRMKSEVAKDLKAKIVIDECKQLPLSDHQRTLYGNAIELFRRRREPGSASTFSNQLSLLHYLRLVCTDPQRTGLDTFVAEPIDAYRTKAPKLDWLMSRLHQIRPLGEKVIIFCEFKNIQRLLRHYIQVEFDLAADIINGDTVANSDLVDSRQKRIKAFQAKPGFGVIILSPVAVGFGVNIQAANHVVHYTRTWNPAKEDQATDRAYRLGQTRDVFVYYPTVWAEDFKTFDVKLDELLTRKRLLAGDMLNGAGDLGTHDFDLDDLSPDGAAVSGDELVSIDDVFRMSPKVFECLAGAIWAKQGWRSVNLTPASADGGVDVVARDGDRGVLIQCKSSGGNRPLNWDAVKEVVAGRALYEKLHPGTAFSLLCFTNGTFNSYAREQALHNGVELVEREHIGSLLDQHPIKFSDLDNFAF